MHVLKSHDEDFLNLPFYSERHLRLAIDLEHWCIENEQEIQLIRQQESSIAAKSFAKLLSEGNWLSHINRFANEAHDFLSIGIKRQVFSYYEDLLDFSYSIQELSSSFIQKYGNQEQKERYLPGVAKGELIGAFAVSELEAGSDIGSMQLQAVKDGEYYILNGDKAWIAQGDIADFCIVIARTGDGPGALGLSAFIVDTDDPGYTARKVEAVAPRSWAHLHFDKLCLNRSQLMSESGAGFIIAIDILEQFRMTVASAAIGFAKRARNIALQRAIERKAYKGNLFDLQLIKSLIAKMDIQLNSSMLLAARAAWALDNNRDYARHSAIAKYHATERACEIIDSAIQILGAAGVEQNSICERLYRQIRPLRIYEGSSEMLLMNIADAANY